MNQNENLDEKIIIHKLPFSTIAKVLAVVLFLWSMKFLGPLLMTLFLATLIAVSLAPIVTWLEKKGLRRALAISLVTIVLAGSVFTICALIVPRLIDELSSFISSLPKVKEQILGGLSHTNPVRPLIEQNLNKQAVLPKPADIAPIFNAGNVALDGLGEIVLIFVFSIYLLVDGNGVVTWFTAFFKPETQSKIQQTGKEVAPIIFSYVAGQFITSLLSFVYVFAVLSLLHVPSVLLLATLAGIFDVLPVLGFFLAVVPAILFAFSVSGSTALYVFLLYILYHAIENYLIVPAVYGKRLRVSSFVILVTLFAAGLLAGIEGAVAALPIVASYPIVERIWLKKVVGKATIAEHKSQQNERDHEISTA